MMRSGAVWALLGLCGCHTVFPHSPGEAGPGDAPGAELVRRDRGADAGPVDIRSGEARSDAAARDLAGPFDAAQELDGPVPDQRPPDQRPPDAEPPPPVFGTPCAPGCCTSGWCWQHPLPQGNDLAAVWALSPTDVTMVGEHGTILHRYGSSSYYLETSNTKETLRAIWGTTVPKRQLFAVGDKGTILRRDSDSATWVFESGAGSTSLFGVHGTSADELYAVGNSGAIFKRNPMNQTWYPQGWGLPTDSHLRAVWVLGSTVYVGGFLQSAIQPRLWSKAGAAAPYLWIDDTTTGTVEGIWSDGTKLVAVGQNILRQQVVGQPFGSNLASGVFRSVFGAAGKTWVVSSAGIHPLADPSQTFGEVDLAAVHVAPDGTGFVVGRGGTRWTHSGTWVMAPTRLWRSTVTGIWGDSASLPWAATDGGEILRFDGSWQVHHQYKPPLQGLLKYSGVSGQGSTKIAVGESANSSSPHNSAEIVGTGAPTFLGNKLVTLNGVWVEAGSKAHAVTASGVVTLAGTTWTAPAAATQGSELHGIFGFSASQIVAVGKTNTCLLGGSPASWSCAPHGGNELLAVWGADTAVMQRVLYAVGKERIAGAVLSAGVTSVNWNAISLPGGSGTLRAVSGRDPNVVYAVGDEGVIRSKQSALSWPTVEAGTNKHLRGVYLPLTAAAPCDVWVVGESGTILCKKYP